MMPQWSANHRAMFVDQQKAPNAAETRLDVRTILTGIVVPIGVALIATQVDWRRGAALAAVAIAAMVLGAMPHLRDRSRRRVASRSDARLARAVMPTIKELVE